MNHKFIDRITEKYPEIKNNVNRRTLQQIWNKTEFNYINKYTDEIARVKEMLNLYNPLKSDLDNARYKHEDATKNLNDREEFEIYKLKKSQKYKTKTND